MNERWENLDALRGPLLAWYDVHRRVLPWREEPSPYRTWVSEIMLQQTRVAAVLPYFARFMAELPDVGALAAVSEERLFKLWEGLGYYSRARSLRRAAQIVAAEYGGALPHTMDELRALPGIGDYTAAAIASIHFGAPEPAVDGNLLRVAARVCLCAEDVSDAKVRRMFRDRMAAAIVAVVQREERNSRRSRLRAADASTSPPRPVSSSEWSGARSCRASSQKTSARSRLQTSSFPGTRCSESNASHQNATAS